MLFSLDSKYEGPNSLFYGHGTSQTKQRFGPTRFAASQRDPFMGESQAVLSARPDEVNFEL